MGRTSYEVSQNPQNDKSFYFFIGMLLKCLAVLLIIFVILWVVTEYSGNGSNGPEQNPTDSLNGALKSYSVETKKNTTSREKPVFKTTESTTQKKFQTSPLPNIAIESLNTTPTAITTPDRISISIRVLINNTTPISHSISYTTPHTTSGIRRPLDEIPESTPASENVIADNTTPTSDKIVHKISHEKYETTVSGETTDTTNYKTSVTIPNAELTTETLNSTQSDNVLTQNTTPISDKIPVTISHEAYEITYDETTDTIPMSKTTLASDKSSATTPNKTYVTTPVGVLTTEAPISISTSDHMTTDNSTPTSDQIPLTIPHNKSYEITSDTTVTSDKSVGTTPAETFVITETVVLTTETPNATPTSDPAIRDNTTPTSDKTSPIIPHNTYEIISYETTDTIPMSEVNVATDKPLETTPDEIFVKIPGAVLTTKTPNSTTSSVNMITENTTPTLDKISVISHETYELTSDKTTYPIPMSKTTIASDNQSGAKPNKTYVTTPGVVLTTDTPKSTTTSDNVIAENTTPASDEISHAIYHKTYEITSDSTNAAITNSRTTVASHTPLDTKPVETTENISTVDKSTSETSHTISKSDTIATENRTHTATRKESTTTMVSVYRNTPGSITSGSLSSVCQAPSCKRMASEMLYLRDFETNPCENFYKYACSGKELRDTNYLEEIYKRLLSWVKKERNKNEYIMNFNSFHNICVSYSYDFNLRDRLNKIQPYNVTQHNLTQLVIDSILNDTNPFFEVRLKINRDSQKFQFELRPPGFGLDTFANDWNLVYRFQKQCITEKKSNQLAAQDLYIDVTTISRNIKDCIIKKLQTYVSQFDNEYFHNYPTAFADLNNILKLQKYLSPRVEDIGLTIEKFNSTPKYQFGVNWMEVFDKISGKTVPSSNIVIIHQEKYFIELFQKLNRVSTSNLIEILDSYSRIKTYGDILLYQTHGDVEKSCLKLTIDLMPDVATILVYDFVNTYQNMKNTQDLFNDLKQEIGYSLNHSTFSHEYIRSVTKKIDGISLVPGEFSSQDYRKENYDGIMFSSTNLFSLYSILKRNYKKMFYSFIGEPVTPRILLQYFLSSFSTQPKAFTDTKYIVFHQGFLRKVSDELPDYVTLGQLGFHLGQELLKFVDLKQLKNDEDEKILNHFQSNTAVNKENINQITIEGFPYEFKNTNYDLLEALIDNGAFRMVTNIYENQWQKHVKILPITDEEDTKERSFILSALQGHCRRDSYDDFVKEIINQKMVPLIKIENIVRNSEFLAKHFSCERNFKYFAQFPYIGSELKYTTAPQGQ